jgi:hypothetical protein
LASASIAEITQSSTGSGNDGGATAGVMMGMMGMG